MSTFGREMSVANVRPPDGLGLPHQTEKMAHWVDILGQLLSLNHVFKIFTPDISDKNDGYKTLLTIGFGHKVLNLNGQ